LKDAEEILEVERAEEVIPPRFPDSLIVLAKRKGFLFKFVGTALLLSIAAVFLLPKLYTANAKILPPQQNQSMSATAMLNELGPLGALAGSGLGLKTPSDLYIAMLHSRTVADGLIDRFSLLKVYGKELRVDARAKLEERTEISAGKDGVISISVDDRDPQRAADLANGYVQELEGLTRTLALTEAGKRRVFFEREVKLASDDLANAELALKQTQETTGLITLDSQSRAMIESLSSMRARVATQEIVVQSMRSFATPENPELVRAQEELVAMREQLDKMEGGQGKRTFADVPIENVPAVGLEYVRKLREVKYRETLFELLAKQYEAAKIDEARDAMIVQQMDIAVTPEKASWPKRGLIIAISGIFALLVALTASFWMESMERAKKEPLFASKLEQFRGYVLGKRKY